MYKDTGKQCVQGIFKLAAFSQLMQSLYILINHVVKTMFHLRFHVFIGFQPFQFYFITCFLPYNVKN